MWSRVRSLALTGNLKVQYDHAGRRIKKEEPKSLAADGEAAEPTIGRRVQTTVKRIGGKVTYLSLVTQLHTCLL